MALQFAAEEPSGSPAAGPRVPPAPVAGAEPGEVSPVKRAFPVEAAEEVLEAPNPYAPAPAEPDDDWRARTRLVCTPQGPQRY